MTPGNGNRQTRAELCRGLYSRLELKEFCRTIKSHRPGGDRRSWAFWRVLCLMLKRNGIAFMFRQIMSGRLNSDSAKRGLPVSCRFWKRGARDRTAGNGYRSLCSKAISLFTSTWTTTQTSPSSRHRERSPFCITAKGRSQFLTSKSRVYKS